MVEITDSPLPSDEATPEEEFLYLLSEGSDLMSAGRIPEAVEQFERALTLKPDHEQAQNMLGLSLFRLGNLGRAAELFEKLVHNNPVEPSLRLNLAMVHLKGGHLEDAKDELEKVLDLNPDHVRAAAYMGMVCERLGQYVEAGDWYERAGNDAQAEEMRAKTAPTLSADTGLPADDENLFDDEEDATLDEEEATAAPPPAPEPEVQAAAMSALRRDSFDRPADLPSTEDAASARAASSDFGLDAVDDLPSPDDSGEIPIPPALEDETSFEHTMPYATLPAGFDPHAGDDGGSNSDSEVSFADVVVPDPSDTVLSDDKPEGTMPYAVLPPPPPGKAPLDAPDPATRPPAVADVQPMEVDAADIELIPVSDEGEPVIEAAPSLAEVKLDNEQPAERTLPYASLPTPPPGKAALDAPEPDDEEAIAAPVPEPDPELESMPELDDPPDDVPDLDPMPAPTLDSMPAPSPAATRSAREDTLELGSGPAEPPATPPPTGPEGHPTLAPMSLADLMMGELASIPPSPTLSETGHFLFPVEDTAYLRTDLLISLVGSFEVEPVNRRYRGRRTDSLFGGNENPLVAALGRGVAWLEPGESEATVVALDSDELYLIETSLLGFSSGLVWENGRLPDPDGGDLDIVHLRGSGNVAVLTDRALVGVEVTDDRPVTVQSSRLVGWSGQLVPARGPFPGLPEEAHRPSIVRFEGSGRLLLT